MNNNQEQNNTNNYRQESSGGVKFGKGFKQAGSALSDSQNSQQPVNNQGYQVNSQQPVNNQGYQTNGAYSQGNGFNTQQIPNNTYYTNQGGQNTAYSAGGAQPESVKKNIVELYLDFWKNYVVFKGCTTRRDYWLTVLANFIVNFVLLFCLKILFLLIPEIRSESLITMITDAISLVTFIPGISLCTRRLHDTGRSGHWQWLEFTIVGGVVIFVFACMGSKFENNKYRV